MPERGAKLIAQGTRILRARAAVNEATALIGYHSITAHNARVRLEELTHEGVAMLNPLHSTSEYSEPIQSINK